MLWSRSILFTFTMMFFLSFSSCTAKKGRINSVSSAAQNVRRTWVDKWQEGRGWLEKKYTTTHHREIIDQVFKQAFDHLTNPKSLESGRTKVFVLNSLPGTGKTQFVSDLARALGVSDSGYYYKELSKDDRYIDSTPFLNFGIDSQRLNDPDFIALPRIVMFDEYTHAMPFESDDAASAQEEAERRKIVFQKKNADLEELIETQSRRYRALEKTLGTASVEVERQGLIAEREETAQHIHELKEIRELYREQEVALAQAINTAEKKAQASTAEQGSARSNLQILWGALGSGAFQSEAEEGTRKDVQTKMSDLNSSIAEVKAGLYKKRSEIIQAKRELQEVKDVLLEEYRLKNSKLTKDWEVNRQRLVDEARKTYDASYNRRVREWEEAVEQAQLQAPGVQSVFNAAQINGAVGGGALFGPGAPPAQAAANLAASDRGPKPVYSFRPPDDLPEAPVFDDELLYLGTQRKYTILNEKIEELSEEEREIERTITRWIENSSRLLDTYHRVYPGALIRLENDRGQQGGIDVDEVIRRNLGITLEDFGSGDGVEKILAEARENWSNLSKSKRLLEIFAANPTRFFQINDEEISQQVNATTFRTGHIVLFLASNVFYVQNQALKLFPTKDETYPICDSEQVRLARGSWPRLPDHRDPECLRALVQGIADSPEAKQAMSDALYGLFGSRSELFMKNIPALQSRLGGAPVFFAPPGSKDYGNFVDFELDNVRETVRNSASLYSMDGFVPPEILFTDRLRQKLYQDRVDANAGYRGLQDKIGSVVFAGVQREVLVDVLTAFRNRPTGDQQTPVKKRRPPLPKQVVFDYDPADGALTVQYDKSKAIRRKIEAPFVTQSEAAQQAKLGSRAFVNRLSALWLAGEITLTSLLFESLPGIDISFAVDALGVQERAKQQIPEWSLDGFVTNWPAEADNVLAHFGGSAAMMVVAPYVSVLPETENRYAAAETLISGLHKKLRAEAAKAIGPESQSEKIAAGRNILSRIGNGYLLEHPVYKVLLNHLGSQELSSLQIAEVKKASLSYMVQYALDHQALIEFVARRFLDVVDDASEIKKLKPQDVKEALLAANDLVASNNILPILLLNKIQSDSQGVKLGQYDRTTLLQDVVGMRSDATPGDVSERAMRWSSLNPNGIFNGISRSLSSLSRRIADETNPSAADSN